MSAGLHNWWTINVHFHHINPKKTSYIINKNIWAVGTCFLFRNIDFQGELPPKNLLKLTSQLQNQSLRANVSYNKITIKNAVQFLQFPNKKYILPFFQKKKFKSPLASYHRPSFIFYTSSVFGLFLSLPAVLLYN